MTDNKIKQELLRRIKVNLFMEKTKEFAECIECDDYLKIRLLEAMINIHIDVMDSSAANLT